MVDDPTVQRVTARLVEAVDPSAKVILFGSHARGDARPDSDLDFLVITPTSISRVEETARLRRAVGKVGVAVDILVYTDEQAREWGHVENTVLNDALREGRVVGRNREDPDRPDPPHSAAHRPSSWPRSPSGR